MIAYVSNSIRDFFEAGGPVLYAILMVTALMWALIVERLWFFRSGMPRIRRELADLWALRSEVDSWRASAVRRELLSRGRLAARKHLLLIRTLMAILPLLGLLGTVTGMITVFDAMAFAGSGNARLMAGGIYRATLPTMAGLVAALSAVYLVAQLEQFARAESRRLREVVHGGRQG